MRRTALWLMLIGLAIPTFAADQVPTGKVTVAQLERWLTSTKNRNDRELAQDISALELTQRLSSARLQQLSALLPHARAREALLALADTAAFLPPPPDQIPALASPDLAAQRRMMAHTVDYLSRALRLLPNLIATRSMTSFASRPSQYDSEASADNPLRLTGKSALTVFYRDGHEFLDAGVTKSSKPRAPEKGLTTWGEFGPILGAVFIDAARNHLAWSHWELSPAGPEAVFRYSVPVERSHYDLHICCIPQNYGLEMNVLTQRVGYHGEITIDPDSGTILRITVIADLPPNNPISRASIAVEYGPEEIGGETYFCPVRGIALVRAVDLSLLGNSSANVAFNPPSGAQGRPAVLERTSVSSAAQGPQQTLLNDVGFRQFHIFRSQTRILTANQAEAEARRPRSPIPTAAPASTSAPASGVDSSSASETARPAEELATDAAVAAATPASLPVAAPSGAPPAPPAFPEVAVSNAYGLPEAPAAAQSSGNDSSATFRINARLVDVALVALDKKGHPVTNLKPEDIEVFDDKTKVELDSFSLAESAAPEKAPNSAQSAAAAPKPQYSNHVADSYKQGSTGAQLNTIILLLDDTLSFSDLTNARRQMEDFLSGLHGDERVAVYVMVPGGFTTLQNTTTDHALLAAKLAKWTPSAQNISNGEEQEARNRQTMQYVLNPEDLLSVNGNSVTDATGHTQSTDPSLRTLGDSPGRDALSGLVILARRLATVPGHKSLVWIASDNTLADWNFSAMNLDKGSKNIEPAALRAQEAMNDAHVSVYPLDASQLEAGGLDASVADRNVQLNPTYQQTLVAPALAAANDPAFKEANDIDTGTRDDRNGRMTAQMQQDAHGIQGVYREIADATGGRAFPRASDLTGELNGVAADGRATYLLSFTPPTAADNKYHFITIKTPDRKKLKLRYRTGYFYRQEASTMKDRFRDAAFQPEDASDIGLTADLVSAPDSTAAAGRTVKLNITASDLALSLKDAFWTDKLDVFLVERKFSTIQANVTGQVMALRLKSASYQKYLHEGLPFNQLVELGRGVGAVRIVVIDENSGKMGSVTIPAAAFAKTS